MTSPVSRRTMLHTSSSLLATAAFGSARSSRLQAAAPQQPAPAHTVHETKVISRQPDKYCGWPTLARRKNGELLVTWSGGRESHVCPFGRVEMIRSGDGGETWSYPRVLLDGPIDDRDSGVLETAKGSLLVTTFTSLAYVPQLEQALARGGKAPGWNADRLDRWQAAHNRISAEARQRELGTWMIRSTDGGITWSARYDSVVNSPHGPVQLSDGRILYPGKQLWRENPRVGVAVSTDDGTSWEWLAEIPARPGDDPNNYHELHGVEAADGRLVVHIRNHNKANHRETLQTISTDGGSSWSVPESIGVWGLPSHLLRLKDDRLLMSYGHRRKPLGNQARLSEDGGRTWLAPMILSGDGITGDLGYPSTVQLDDGSLVSVWYERMKGSPRAVLRMARWSLG